MSRSDCLFPPQPQNFLHGPIGKTEEHGFLIGFMRGRIPGRNHKNIARRPLERGVADLTATPSFDNGIDRSLRRPVRTVAKTGRQQLDKFAMGWHGISAWGWV